MTRATRAEAIVWLGKRRAETRFLSVYEHRRPISGAVKRGSGVRSFNGLVLFRHLMSDVFKALRSLSLPRAVGAAVRSIGPRFRPGVVKLKNEDRPYFFNSPYRWLWNDKERMAVYVLGI